MSRLVWDKTGERYYETGTKNGVLYPMAGTTYGKGVAWNGLTAVTESPSGAEANPLYADDIKYLEMRSAEEFGGTIEAYTYPDEWAQCDGSAYPVEGVQLGQQSRIPFGFCYRTVLGNDTELDTHGYKLHLVYNATASPSERAYQTVNDSPEAITFSWEFTTTPIGLDDYNNEHKTSYRPVACITIDSTKVDSEKLTALEDILYGKDAASGQEAVDPRLPLPDEVITLLS